MTVSCNDSKVEDIRTYFHNFVGWLGGSPGPCLGSLQLHKAGAEAPQGLGLPGLSLQVGPGTSHTDH